MESGTPRPETTRSLWPTRSPLPSQSLAARVLEVWWRLAEAVMVLQDEGRSWLLDPVSDEDVRLALHLAVAVRRPHELAPVRGEHREGIEFGVCGDLLEARAIGIH